MQNFLVLFLFLAFGVSSPRIDFELLQQDFGQVREGKIVNLSFPFQNKGDKPLLIKEVSGSCGCTAVSYPTYPVKPGDKDRLIVKFITKGKSGFQDLEVRVKSNASSEDLVLHITGEVLSR